MYHKKDGPHLKINFVSWQNFLNHLRNIKTWKYSSKYNIQKLQKL